MQGIVSSTSALDASCPRECIQRQVKIHLRRCRSSRSRRNCSLSCCADIQGYQVLAGNDCALVRPSKIGHCVQSGNSSTGPQAVSTSSRRSDKIRRLQRFKPGKTLQNSRSKFGQSGHREPPKAN